MRGKDNKVQEKQADINKEQPLNDNYENYTNVDLEVLSKQISCSHLMQLHCATRLMNMMND